MTHTNGHTPDPHRIIVETWHHDTALADLDAWDDAITALDAALTDVAHARHAAQDAEGQMAVIEARTTLATNGANAETRKAAVALVLAGDGIYRQAATRAREARLRLTDAERRAIVAKERCRLLRVALALAGPFTEPHAP